MQILSAMSFTSPIFQVIWKNLSQWFVSPNPGPLLDPPGIGSNPAPTTEVEAVVQPRVWSLSRPVSCSRNAIQTNMADGVFDCWFSCDCASLHWNKDLKVRFSWISFYFIKFKYIRFYLLQNIQLKCQSSLNEVGYPLSVNIHYISESIENNFFECLLLNSFRSSLLSKMSELFNIHSTDFWSVWLETADFVDMLTLHIQTHVFIEIELQVFIHGFSSLRGYLLRINVIIPFRAFCSRRCYGNLWREDCGW